MTALRLIVASAAGGIKDHAGSIMLFNLDDGKVTDRSEGQPFWSPSFIVWSSVNNRFYITSEVAEGPGLLTGVRLDNQNFEAGESATTGGNGAVHLCLDRRNKHIFVANYQANRSAGMISVAAFALDADGAVGVMTGSAVHEGSGPNKRRQDGPHCHSVAISPDNRFVVAADLGTDSLYFYRFDPMSGEIILSSRLKLPPGTGPRHSAFHSTLPILYVTGELNSTFITVQLNDALDGGTVIDQIPATDIRSDARNYPSGLAVTPDGHHVIVANRGADTLATFFIDPANGKPGRRVERDCGGRFPRSIRLDASGRYLAVANQKSENVAVFGWDFAHGALSEAPLTDISIAKPYDALIV